MSAVPAIVPAHDAPRVPLRERCVLRVYDDPRALDSLGPAWDALLEKYPLSTTFSTREWLTCWWQAYGEGAQALILALFDGAQSLVGLALFSIRNERGWAGSAIRVLRLLGDGSFDSDNLDIPVVPGFEELFASTILEYLDQQKSRFDICELNTLPPVSLVGKQLINLAKQRRWNLLENSSVCSAIHLPLTWDQYLASLSGEERRNIPRYTRRLHNRYKARIYRCRDEHALPICLDALFRLHQARWQDAGDLGTFSSRQRRDFYYKLSQRLLARKYLELWVLELDGEISAVQFAFRFGDRVFQLQEGYDHRRSSDRSGYVLRGEVLRTLISESVRTYDFLGGEDAYKSRWGAKPDDYLNLRFAIPWTKGSTLLRLTGNIEASKQWLRRKLPPSAWSLLHTANAMLKRSHSDRQLQSQSRSLMS